ncbi:putative microtubule-associated protein Gb4 [Trypanosoma rangeli]|uniref:Putative microtubule-associated protein Gb4 n=1 Tax=Trypanosoma rangeli TaxID=5698 RepID=A0A3R7KQP3_TRYRA|nr:putative microtubule-associated protein Gb4 [Trypanosoma rangeli]RNF07831.1 putative microtubule-associated protein Gb4 [Trypanosoma rangeli]|eukprot:RNF07831.1 putative microtubule-associated protein Gb4 [Trypanosoma rangeli]
MWDMFGSTSMPVGPSDSQLGGLKQSFLRDYRMSTVASKHGFVANAETLSPYPDGVCVRVARRCRPNPTLLGTTTSAAYQARAKSHFSSQGMGFSSGYQQQRPLRYGGRGPVAGHLAPGRARGGENDPGYWSVVYISGTGEEVGAIKLPDLCRRGSLTFERAVGAIEEGAAFLGLRVSYITYFDKDFGAYTLLTHRTVLKCIGLFRVVVASISEVADKSPTAKVGGEATKDGVLALHNEVEKPTVDAFSKQMTGLFETFNAPSLTSKGANKAGVSVPEEWMAEPGLLFLAEATEREVIAADEASWRLIIQARENTRITFWPRGSLW